MKRLGIDVGSTTIKCVVIDENNEIQYSSYDRHMSKISEKTSELLEKVADEFGEEEMEVSISGSAGMGLAEYAGVSFVQEVFATKTAVDTLNPNTNVVIELGGEDAKILFLTGGFEARMNGSCAGGTGAFIDQMATLIQVDADDLNVLASKADKLYTIASRCGVFAKTDIQPLLNQGASTENIAASILYAVVNQTIGGLAQGREIKGNVLYLGGPLTFFSELRKSFDKSLQLEGLCPEHSTYYVAIGAAISGDAKPCKLKKIAKKAIAYMGTDSYMSCPPLFESEKDYEEFCYRHEHNSDHIGYIKEPTGDMYLGIDAGSTTAKAVVCDKDGNILDSMYQSNNGNPVPIIKDYLGYLYKTYPGIHFAGSAVTGYGEDIIRNAFGVDIGIVETVAHYTAAKKFNPDVDFIIDIGGQDIKCFKIRNQAIDNIFLNEACSSGCGSFLQTFAQALQYDVKDFVKLGLFADRPVDLGSRCTVFMNSSVKQAQKDGATVENISAGLSISVVKNALYKVIRCGSASELGQNIVVQGGTFLNDVILRAFEQELGLNVIRPTIAGIMGAYGAALYAIERQEKHANDEAAATIECGLLTEEDIHNFVHTVKVTTCQGCNNNCQLTVNNFGGSRTFIAGNRCERPIKGKNVRTHYNMYEYKLDRLEDYRGNDVKKGKLTVGIPLGLNMYELLPFWWRLFKELDMNVIVSPNSNRDLFLSGQHTVPSDTICFPAKLVHGHIEALVEENPDFIFYPCMSYNVNEAKGDNHYNCPVVAYYPEVIEKNVKSIENITFIHEFVGIHNRKEFPKKFTKILNDHLDTQYSVSHVRVAMDAAFEEYERYMNDIRDKAEEFLTFAREENRPVIVLAGRPYHLDLEVNHGLDKMMSDLGAVIVTEDGLYREVEAFRTTVLNQWTYHARLYLTAQYVAQADPALKMNLVQLVSFGCGVDAITTDEVRDILESEGKIYTQLKIDEVTNMGAAKIRIRSLFAAEGIEV